MALQTQPRYAFEDYLTAERRAEVRHEYADGQVFAMVGASAEHNIIVANITAALVAQLKDRPCLVFANDMKVRIDKPGACTYPDLAALCGDAELFDERRDVLLNPSLIVEVLSASTEAYDRGEKFTLYRRLPSLREYALVSQDKPRAELFSRQADGGWLLVEYAEDEDTIGLPSIGCVLVLRDLYHKVAFRVSQGGPQVPTA